MVNNFEITADISTHNEYEATVEGNTSPLTATLEKADVIYKDDYEQLKNKPSINGVELIGNKTTEDLGDVALTNLEIFNLIQIAKGRA